MAGSFSLHRTPLRLFFLIEACPPKLAVTSERSNSPFYVCLVICLPSPESNLLEDRALSALFFTVFPVPDAGSPWSIILCRNKQVVLVTDLAGGGLCIMKSMHCSLILMLLLFSSQHVVESNHCTH